MAALVPAETNIGVIRVVGAGGRFVLVETPSALAASALREGRFLRCRSPAGGAADLRVSREHHETFVVANVIAGEPTVGASVYATPPGMPTPAPLPTPFFAPLAPRDP